MISSWSFAGGFDEARRIALDTLLNRIRVCQVRRREVGVGVGRLVVEDAPFSGPWNPFLFYRIVNCMKMQRTSEGNVCSALSANKIIKGVHN